MASTPGSTAAQTENGVESGPDAVPARIAWQSVNRAPDGFRMEMPEGVKEIRIPAYTGLGGAEQVDMLLSNPDARTTYSVSWSDDPPVVRAAGQSVQRIFDLSCDGALARTQSALVSESNTTVDGFPARDFTGRNAQGGLFNSRLVLAGQRLYMLVASFPSASARRQQDVTHFFHGFHLTASSSIPESMPLAPAKGD